MQLPCSIGFRTGSTEGHRESGWCCLKPATIFLTLLLITAILILTSLHHISAIYSESLSYGRSSRINNTHFVASKALPMEVSNTTLNNASQVLHSSGSKTATLTQTTQKGPLMTLFTTFTDAKHRINIQSNVVRNWATFLPDIQPILYTAFSNGTLIDLAKSCGWKVFRVPRVNANGTPYLKDLFFDAVNRTNSLFYGFSNGDILFTEGLLRTVEAVYQNIDILKTTLVIGRRTNLEVNYNDTRPFYNYTDIKNRAKSGKLFRMDAEDYFIMSNVSGFPWRTIKDVVIGRPGYDNYLVAISIMSNKTVVDATSTVLAVHQTGMDGNQAGAKNSDSQHNKKIIGKFNYNKGLTGNAKYTTHFDFRGNVFIKTRR